MLIVLGNRQLGILTDVIQTAVMTIPELDYDGTRELITVYWHIWPFKSALKILNLELAPLKRLLQVETCFFCLMGTSNIKTQSVVMTRTELECCRKSRLIAFFAYLAYNNSDGRQEKWHWIKKMLHWFEKMLVGTLTDILQLVCYAKTKFEKSGKSVLKSTFRIFGQS